MKKKIYIAGKVTGEEIHECTAKFGDAATQLEGLGFQPVNPIEVVGDWRCPWEPAMRKCIVALLECQAIVMLPCWKQSQGARLELNIAANLGMEILFM
jgi:hypothetical protein